MQLIELIFLTRHKSLATMKAKPSATIEENLRQSKYAIVFIYTLLEV